MIAVLGVLLFLAAPGEANAVATDLGSADYDSLYNQASHVVLATVLELGASPGFWSGRTSSFQTVVYKLTASIKGHGVQERFTVYHVLVEGSKTADPKEARLEPTVFKEGEQLMLFLLGRPDFLFPLDEDTGALSATDEVVEKTMKAHAKAQGGDNQ